MFKKLRNKFLFLNVVSILIVLIISFTAIFTMTYQNVKKDINIQLQKELKEKSLHPGNNMKPNSVNEPPLSFQSTSFCVLLNTDNELVKIFNTPFDIHEDDVLPLISKVAANTKESSFFKYDGQYWAYKLVPGTQSHLLAFVNITSNVNVLLNFIYAFIGVSIVLFGIIVFWSYSYANRAIQPIKESFERQEEFISNASHELKTPLTIITTTLNVIRSNQDQSVKEQEKWLGYIENETNRMSGLTNDLLYLTRMEDTNDILLTSFNLTDVMDTVILSMEALAYEHSITIQFDSIPIQYYGNVESIQRLIYILLDNAIKYNIKDGYIKVSLSSTNKNISMQIENSSEGMREDECKKIFDRFYRADESRNSQNGGYGIGLSIAKGIIEQHHGEIEVTSQLNTSTIFTITLPIFDNRKK